MRRAQAIEDIDVQVRKERSAYEVNLEFTVPATIEQTWSVLADYEHMAQIRVEHGLEPHREPRRQPAHRRADEPRQGRPATRLGRRSPRDHVDAVQRDPLASQIKGDLKASDFTTSLHAEGSVTRVTVSGRLVAAAWASWTLGAETVAAHTRRQYQELRNEILKRKGQ